MGNSAQITAGGDFTLQALTTNNKGIQAVTTTGNSGVVGIAAAIASTHDSTTAQMNGTATVGGTALVQAQEVKNGVMSGLLLGIIPNMLAGVAANSGVGNYDTGMLISNLQGGLPNFFSQLASYLAGPFQYATEGFLGTQSPTFSQSAAGQVAPSVAVDVEVNLANASLGEGATLRAHGNLTVDAQTNDRPNVIASSGISTPQTGTGIAPGSTTSFDGSFAVAYGDYTNTATATIGAGANVDSGGQLSVTSETFNDYEDTYNVNLVTPFEPMVTKTDASEANDVTLTNGEIVEVDPNHTGNGSAGHWYEYLGGTQTNVDLTTEDFGTPLWDDLGQPWEYEAKEFIGNLTTYLDNSFGLDNNFADTWSQATSNNNTKYAIAGSWTTDNLNQTSSATISQGAQINQDKDRLYRTRAQNVFVLATNTDSSLNLGGSVQVGGLSGSSKTFSPGVNNFGAGVQASQGAIGAAFVWINYQDNTTATIDTGVNLSADSLDVDAENAVLNASILISGATSGNFGGIGVASIIEVNDTTLAQIAAGSSLLIGDGPVVETTPAAPSIVPGVQPLANTSLTSLAFNANELPGATGTDTLGNSTDTIDASTIVQAHDALYLLNGAGGIMSANNVGVGASVDYDDITRDTEAFIGDPNGSKGNASAGTLTSAGNVIDDARNSGSILTLAVAAATVSGNSSSTSSPTGSPAPQQGGQYGVGVSGDVSFNQVTDTTLAYVDDTALAASAVSVNATNQTLVIALSGSVAWVTNSQGTSVGIAGSYTENDLGGTTTAFVDNASVTLTGNFTVDATTSAEIYSISASGSFAHDNQGIAVAGQVSINSIGISTLAEVLDQSSVSAGNVAVTATSSEQVFAIAGALAYGGRAGFGTSVSVNTIPGTGSNSVWALIQDSDVTATGAGTLALTALSQETVDSITAAIGASKKGMAVALAVSINTISPDTEAVIRRRATHPPLPPRMASSPAAA